MALTTQSIDYINWSNFLKGNGRKAPDRLEAMLTTPSQCATLKADATALSVIFSADPGSVRMLERMREVGKGDEMAAAFYASLGYSSLSDFLGCGVGLLIAGGMIASEEVQAAALASASALGTLFSSGTALRSVMRSSECMTALAASTTAMNAVVASSEAMAAFSESATAMDAIASNSAARTKIMASSAAKAAFGSSHIGAVKLAAALSGLDASDFANAAGFASKVWAMIAASVAPAALNIICRSPEFRAAWCGSAHFHEFSVDLGDMYSSLTNSTYFSSVSCSSNEFYNSSGSSESALRPDACWARAYCTNSGSTSVYSLQTGACLGSGQIDALHVPGGVRIKNHSSYSGSGVYVPK